jgi:Na+-driven multidrug efflux pump
MSYQSILQGAGDTKGTMWVIRLPLSSLLSLVMEFGASGVWTAMVISMICQGIMMTWWFRQGKWKKLKMIDINE